MMVGRPGNEASPAARHALGLKLYEAIFAFSPPPQSFSLCRGD